MNNKEFKQIAYWAAFFCIWTMQALLIVSCVMQFESTTMTGKIFLLLLAEIPISIVWFFVALKCEKEFIS